MRKQSKPSPVTVQALQPNPYDGEECSRIYRGGALVGFVARLPAEPHTVHPFKVFTALCGYGGPPRRGEMVAADYVAHTAHDAATRNASRLS